MWLESNRKKLLLAPDLVEIEGLKHILLMLFIALLVNKQVSKIVNLSFNGENCIQTQYQYYITLH